MKRIWKFRLGTDVGSSINITMPQGAKILTVNNQVGDFMLWAEVDSEAPKVSRRFIIYPTGGILLEKTDAKYIGTIFLNWTVWHIFDLGEVE